MSNTHFRTVAQSLATSLDNAGIKYDVYSLLNLADDLNGKTFIDPSLPTPEQSHDARVLSAIQSREVMGQMHDGKKINAIKELCVITSCGLKEAKDACGDHRVQQALARFNDGYGVFEFYRIESLDWL
jgi:hypothetical protein